LLLSVVKTRFNEVGAELAGHGSLETPDDRSRLDLRAIAQPGRSRAVVARKHLGRGVMYRHPARAMWIHDAGGINSYGRLRSQVPLPRFGAAFC